ncbi:MAG: oxidoreductase [Chitinophagaceae bacterium]|uniref:WD40/YVTN/BNR-like repeat-containing protein n=1 Tax=unclassified Paraflavitalea TaxID=2798305 RepID=UPI003D325C8D|nr:oxidoreductase [Chitinophagaceae bacterium]
MIKLRLLGAALLLSSCLFSQKITELSSGTTASFRGLHAVSKSIIWASGSAGTIGKSLDGGVSWQWQQIKGFEKREFRDIHAFDENNALVIAIAEPAQILRTNDGGKNWQIVFTDSTKGMFLDAVDFFDAKNGLVVGDPINGKVYFASTTDAGNTWKKLVQENSIQVTEGEAFFASSGTNIRMTSPKSFLLVSGGKASNFYINTSKTVLPLKQGAESTGANSIDQHKSTLIVVGGDFSNDKDTAAACAVSFDKGSHWNLFSLASGYKSCVKYVFGKTWISSGTSGVDISNDNGKTWKNFSKLSFHVISVVPRAKKVILAGGRGKFATIEW